eukprot:TRINITY_DN5065_c1_g2_i1.p1 TRINITY_DN5065_c1_g2~~TRINITY_DN5065_c1_g2_i1.p1  ORF type:complete len:347 (+),score=72.61 TRINITY_DN5065_c1_g2_i1:81-1121(+)
MPEDSLCPERCGQYADVIFLASGFALSSSLLVVINKWALQNFKFGATLTAIQFAVSAGFAFLLGLSGYAEVDALDYKKVKAFMPAVCMFYISVATNLKLLESANVDTYIVVRSCVPLFTLGLEVVYLKSPFPGMKTVACLVLIFLGACGYVATDSEFKWSAYSYALAYLCAFTVDQVLIKKIVMDTNLTRWGLVYYNNLLALVLMPAGGFLTGEWFKLHNQLQASNISEVLMKPNVLMPVLLSCAFGLSISFFALNARRALTATAFTVLGVICKFVTVFVNTIIWDAHADRFGILCVCVCILGGILFQKVQGSAVVTPVPPAEKLETRLNANNQPLTEDEKGSGKK